MSNKRWHIKDPNHMFIDTTKREILGKALQGSIIRSIFQHPPFLLNKNLIPVNIATASESSVHDKQRQFSDWEDLWEDPLTLPYTLCISSTPTETAAQIVALRLFLRAMAKSNSERQRPIWHNLKGGISFDKLRDSDDIDTKISLLILNNAPFDMTPYKLEKLRDIMTEYSHIPRVIVTTAADPFEFMTERLKMQVNFLLYIGAEKEKRWSGDKKDKH